MSNTLAVTALAQVNIEEAFNDGASSVAEFVPKFIAFLVILIIGWFIARALRALVSKGLEKVRFDRAVERGGIARALSNTNYDAISLVAALVYYAVLLIALQMAFGVFGPNPVSDMIASIVAWLPMAIVAIIIVVIAAAIARVVRDLLEGILSELSFGSMLAKITSWFIIGLGVIAALNQVGIATTVTSPVLIAFLATLGGIVVIGVGGGLIRPMQQRWEGWLGHIEQETARVAQQSDSAAAYVATEPSAGDTGSLA